MKWKFRPLTANCESGRSSLLRSAALFSLAAMAMVLAAPQAAWAQRLSSYQDPLPRQSQLDRFNLTRAWIGTATLDAGRDRLLSLSLDDDKLYAQSSNGVLTAFDSANGKRAWAAQLGRRDEVTFPCAFNEDQVLVVYGMTLFALEKETGNIRWKLRLSNFPSTGPYADAANLYIGFLDGTMVAFDLRKIEELYRKSMLPQWSYLTIRWRYDTNRKILAPATSTGGLVFFASTNRNLYAVTPDTRDLMFQLETDAPIVAPIVQHRDTLLVASQDSRLYSINLLNGTVLWQFVTGSPISQSPQVIEDDLFLVPDRGGMHLLSATSGKQKWRRPEVAAFLAATPSAVYASDRQDNLLVISRANGALLGIIPLDAFTLKLSNDRTDRIYVGTRDGLIMCLHERDRNDPIFYKYPERQPLLPVIVPEDEADDEAMDEPSPFE